MDAHFGEYRSGTVCACSRSSSRARPASGRPTVLTALADWLTDDGVPHAALDVEALVWAHPAPSEDQRSRQLAAACALHREDGHSLLLIAETLESDHDVARLRAAAGDEEYLLVRLEAAGPTLARRIIQREPAGWSGLPALVERSEALAGSMPALRGVDLVLSTEGERPDAVAERIRAARPDQLAARRAAPGPA